VNDHNHDKERGFSRRDLLKGAAGALAAGLGTAATAGAAPAREAPLLPGVMGQPANLPKPKGPRVVVLGGGWGGLTISKYLRREYASFDVVMIDSRPSFMSCPMSNLWLAGIVDYEFLCHSYLDAARRHGYIFFNATMIDADRERRIVYTDQGWLKYDYLVLAPGIDYDYDAIGIHDPREVSRLMQEHPAAFKPGSEHLTLKRKIEEFSRGLFVLTVPSGNYRCLPAPYERACMVAAVFKRKKLPAKVLLLDHNPDIKIKKAGFHAAFEELYKDYLEYVPSVDITGIDLSRKIIQGQLEDYSFDDASIYPRIRASRIIETLGLLNPYSPQKEAWIDQYRNNVVDDPRVYVIGDSRPMGYSKSGSTAQMEGKYVAKVIAGVEQGKEVPWEAPYTSCYSMVNADPPEAIYFGSEYLPPVAALTAASQERIVEKWIEFGTAFAWRDERSQRTADMGQAMIEWGRAHYREMFE
jgi:NADPH-dependent 2,4-dienoyl-CoA reductase/sulfur reductase-like enzyme